MNELLLDLRHAGRALARQPGFAATAILTLALGIGATTAIVSLAHEALFTAPPVRDADRLAVLYTASRRGAPRSATSYPDFQDYRARSRAFTDMAAWSWIPLSAGGESETGLLSGQVVTGNYFQLLGILPALGRLLQPADDLPGLAAPAVVVSHDLWRRRLGASPAAVGSTLRLNGVPVTVVGVAAAGFTGLAAGRGPDLWIAMRAAPLMGEGVGSVADPRVWTSRGNRWLSGIVARLTEGAALEQGRAEMAGISSQLEREDADRGARAITVDPLPRRILPAGTDGDVARFLGLLIGVVACALLLTSINLASLLLARASARQREMGIRLSVGAGRGRLIRQLLTEGVVLAGLGGAAGVVVAIFALDLLAGFALPGGLPLGDLRVRLDARLLAIAGGSAVASILLFGIAPALQTTRTPVLVALRGEEPAAPGRLRRWLVSAQVALCLMLLVGAGLFLRTLQGALAFDTGFRADGVAVARYSLALLRYPPEARAAFADRLLTSVTSLPGVEGAALATLVPLQAGGHLGTMASVDGYQPAEGEEMRTDLVRVTPGYFDVLGIPLLRGRAVLPSDGPGAPLVAVINRTAAHRWWAGRDPVGGTFRLGDAAYQVVGVVDDATWETPGAPLTPYIFVALAQSAAPMGSLTLAVRTPGQAATLLPLLRRAFRDLDPDLSLMTAGTLDDWLADTLGAQRTGAALLSLFGVLAMVIAALGIYGVVAYYVTRQTRAIGVRVALGAPRSHVVGLVARGIGGPVGLGVAAGFAAAWALAGTVERFLFGVQPHDPVTFATMALALAVVAAAATAGPVRRALRINPTEALRHE
jgi:predicted permease